MMQALVNKVFFSFLHIQRGEICQFALCQHQYIYKVRSSVIAGIMYCIPYVTSMFSTDVGPRMGPSFAMALA